MFFKCQIDIDLMTLSDLSNLASWKFEVSEQGHLNLSSAKKS